MEAIPQGLDPTAFILTKAIKRSESGGSSDPYKVKGDNATSTGAYQIQNKNWKPWAKQYLGDANAEMNEENQNKLAYTRVKDLLGKGYSQSQVASIWNSGQADAAKVGKGYNAKIGLNYDVPGYVSKVQKNYAQIQKEIQLGYNPTPYSSPGSSIKPPAESPVTEVPEKVLGEKISSRFNDAGNALINTAQGKINPLSGIIQGVGAGAGAINDVAQAGLELIPGVKQVEGLIGKGVAKLANTDAGKAVTGALGGFAQAHPELSADIGAVGNIVGAAGLVTGAGALKGAVKSGIGKAMGKNPLSATIDALSPEIKAGTAKGAVDVGKRGVTKSGVSGTISRVDDPLLGEMAEVIHAQPGNFGKKFDKYKTNTEKLNAIEDVAIPREAQAMRNTLNQEGVNPIINPDSYQRFVTQIESELGSNIGLVGDSGEYARRALEFFKKQLPRDREVTLTDWLDARQALDREIIRTRPKAFEKASNFSDGVSIIRSAANDLLDAEAPNAGIKASLRRQSLLYKAAKNLASKADKEVGTTRFGRFADRYPKTKGLVKFVGRRGLEAAGLGAGYGIYKNITGE